jgi:hypothetical protein
MHQITKAPEEAMESKWAGCQQIHKLENIYITIHEITKLGYIEGPFSLLLIPSLTDSQAT